MMNWVLDNAPHIGLLGFFVAFIGIALWAYWPSNKARLQEHASIPLNTDNPK
jgi:cbb3-type cytochrome oxidase subunit 3